MYGLLTLKTKIVLIHTDYFHLVSGNNKFWFEQTIFKQFYIFEVMFWRRIINM